MNLYSVRTHNATYYIVADSFDDACKKLKDKVTEAFSPHYFTSDHYLVKEIKILTEEAKDSSGKPYFYSENKRLII